MSRALHRQTASSPLEHQGRLRVPFFFLIYFYWFIFLVVSYSLWDFSSSTRDHPRALGSENAES